MTGIKNPPIAQQIDRATAAIAACPIPAIFRHAPSTPQGTISIRTVLGALPYHDATGSRYKMHRAEAGVADAVAPGKSPPGFDYHRYRR